MRGEPALPVSVPIPNGSFHTQVSVPANGAVYVPVSGTQGDMGRGWLLVAPASGTEVYFGSGTAANSANAFPLVPNLYLSAEFFGAGVTLFNITASPIVVSVVAFG